jgi:hypothetical protein
MAEKEPTGEAFGIHELPASEGDDDPFASIPAEREGSAPEAQPSQEAEDVVPQPAEGAEQPTAEEPSAPSEPTEQPAPEGFLGGKYKTPEELEAAARNYISRNTRYFEENRQLKSELDQYRQALEQLAPIAREHFQRRQRQQAQPQAPSMDSILEIDDPEKQRQALQNAINAAADQAVQRRVQEQVQPIYEQQQQAFEAQREQEIRAFYEAHPDHERNSEADQEIGEYFLQLRRELSEHEDPIDAEMDEEAFPLTRDNLEVLYQAVSNPKVRDFFDSFGLVPQAELIEIAEEVGQNPRLERILRAMPDLMETEEGMELARQQAASPTLQSAQQNQEAEQAQTAEAARRAAFSETGGTGAPVQTAPGQTPERDWLDDALDLGKERQGSVFFG